VASALVNTMQEASGSIDRHLRPQHHRGERDNQLPHRPPHKPKAPAAAATHGHTLAFTISAVLLGLGAILAILTLPSRKRLAELTGQTPPLTPSQSQTRPRAPARGSTR
jgi:hypothetical protein